MSFSPSRLSSDSHVSPLSSPRDTRGAFKPSNESVSRGVKGKGPERRESVDSFRSSLAGMLNPPNNARSGAPWQPSQNAISTLLQPPIVRTGLRPHTSAPVSSAHKPPSSKDIPPVTLTNIRQVKSAAFKPYLAQVGSLYDAFQDAKAERKREGLQRKRSNDTIAAETGAARLWNISQRTSEGVPGQSLPSLKDHEQQSTEIPSLDGAASPRALRKQPGHELPPLSTIPDVYREEEFRLENPRTFDIVSERSDVVRRVVGAPAEEQTGRKSVEANGSAIPTALPVRKPLATNAILQEKLSWYMDTVELHLISSISTASTTFFAALGSLRDLYAEAEESVARIRMLREDLRKLDRDMAATGLKIIRLRRRKENMRRLGHAVSQLRRAVEGTSVCRDLIDRGQHSAAMDQVDQLEGLMAGRPDAAYDDLELVDLRQVKATESISNDLRILKISIGRAFESRFIEALLSDQRQHLRSTSARRTVAGWESLAVRSQGGHSRKSSDQVDRDVSVDTLRTQLRPCLVGLNRCRHVATAAAAYRDATLREVKNLIRNHLPSSDDDDTQSIASSSISGDRRRTQQEKSSILARNLRALDADEAEALFVGIYASITEMLRRVAVQVKVLLDLTSVQHGPAAGSAPGSGFASPPKSPGVPTLQAYLGSTDSTGNASMPLLSVHNTSHLDLSNVLGQIVDVAHNQITKILKVRTDQTLQLSLVRVLAYFTLNRGFADECETMSGRGGNALKGVVNAQIKDFVSRMADRERQALAEAMDADQWDATDFPDAENEVLQRVISSSMNDPPLWLKRSYIHADVVPGPPNSTVNGGQNGVSPEGAAAAANPSSASKDKVRRAVIDEQKFILPQSALTVLHGIERFENFISVAPSKNEDLTPVVIDYLKLFNSRSYQLILGAGATKSAGLKNITTRHLALAFQALSFISALIPHIREFVRRQPTSSSAHLFEFDKVRRLYQEHRLGIQEKLVEIMSGRSRTHVAAMRKVNWDDDSAPPTDVSPYMETLTKDTITLHRVLRKHLLEMDLRMVMEPIFQNYREQWGQAFQEVTLKGQEGKDRLLRDAECFNARLSNMEGAGDTGNYIVNIARKHVADSGDATSDAEGERADPSGAAARTDGAQSPEVSISIGDNGTPE